MILTFYILRHFFKNFFLTLFFILFIFFLFDFIHHSSGYFPEHNPPLSLILKFYLSKTPSFVTQAIPLGSLLGSIISMVILSRNNEIIAMRAAGMSLAALGLPFFLGGSLVSASCFVISEYVMPQANEKTYMIEEEIENRTDPKAKHIKNWMRSEQSLFNYKNFDWITKKIHDLKLIILNESFLPTEAIHAKSAIYDPLLKKWLLNSARKLEFDKNHNLIGNSLIDQLALELPIEPNQLEIKRLRPDEMSLKGLQEEINSGKKYGSNTIEFEVAWHAKIAFAFASLIISLMGLQFAFKTERQDDTLKGVLAGILSGLSYWFIYTSSLSFGKLDYIPSFVAAWLANIVLLIITLFQIWRAYKLST